MINYWDCAIQAACLRCGSAMESNAASYFVDTRSPLLSEGPYEVAPLTIQSRGKATCLTFVCV